MDALLIVRKRLELARKRLEDLWDERNSTDKDVLVASEEVDRLINLYNRMGKDKRDLTV